jgi:hypothetical protein
MSTQPPKKPSTRPPPPPRTKSGQMSAVKAFQDEIDKLHEEAVPKMDTQIDRMNDLFKSMTPTPEQSEELHAINPGMPRTPSMVDIEEVMGRAPTTIPEPPVTRPEGLPEPDSEDPTKP